MRTPGVPARPPANRDARPIRGHDSRSRPPDDASVLPQESRPPRRRPRPRRRGPPPWPPGAWRRAGGRTPTPPPACAPRGPLVLRPRVFDRLVVEARELLAEEPRHLDGVGEHEPSAAGGDEEPRGAGLAAGVDPVRAPARQPGDVVVAGQEYALEARRLGDARDPFEFFGVVGWCHGVMTCVPASQPTVTVVPSANVVRPCGGWRRGIRGASSRAGARRPAPSRGRSGRRGPTARSPIGPARRRRPSTGPWR